MKTKIVAFIFLIIFLVTNLTGCLSSEFDVDTSLVVQAIGVDFDFKKGKYKITMQCFDLQKSAGGGEESGSSSGNVTKIIEGKGTSIERAIDDTIQITGLNPILSQNRIIILSETVAANGLYSVIDMFSRSYRLRSSVPVAIAKGFKAADIIKSNEGKAALPAEVLGGLLNSKDINSYLKETKVADVIKLHEEKTTDITIPAMTIVPVNKKPMVKLDGLAVFNEDKLYNYLSDVETRSMLLIMNKLHIGTYVIEKSKYGIATFEILDNKTKIDFNVNTDNSLNYEVKAKIIVDLTELEFKIKHNLTEKEILDLEQYSNKYIQSVTEKLLYKCLNEYRCDVFRIGHRLSLKYPNRYRELKDNWNDYLPKIKTSVQVDTTIRRIGRFSIT